MLPFWRKLKYSKRLKNIDYVESAKNICAMLLALKEVGEQNGGTLCLRNEDLETKTSFITEPCMETAIKALDVDPSLIRAFVAEGDTAFPLDEWIKIVDTFIGDDIRIQIRKASE